jgi:hypothetical protein
VITALTSNQMIAPSYWVDEKTGNDYMLTVSTRRTASRPFRTWGDPPGPAVPTRPPRRVTSIERLRRPTEVGHYQLRRVIDIYVGLAGEDLGARQPHRPGVAGMELPEGVRIDLRAWCKA